MRNVQLFCIYTITAGRTEFFPQVLSTNSKAPYNEAANYPLHYVCLSWQFINNKSRTPVCNFSQRLNSSPYLVTYLLIYLFTYLLTPWCRVLLEKLTGLQLVKKFPAFQGTRRFITALTSVRHLSLSWTSPIQ